MSIKQYFLMLSIYLSLINQPSFAFNLLELLPFNNYQISKVLIGKPAKVDIKSHPHAHKFRTMLRQGVENGVNFAGHYIIATWGCGTSCLELGIIDAHTGKVFFPKELVRVIGISAGDFESVGWTEEEGDCLFKTADILSIGFRKESSLLVAFGFPHDDSTEHELGFYYFSWEDNKLELLGKLLLSSDKAKILNLVACHNNIK